MYFLRAFWSPEETTEITGDTAWSRALEKSAEPWWGTLKTSACRLISPRLWATVSVRAASSLRSPVKRKLKLP